MASLRNNPKVLSEFGNIVWRQNFRSLNVTRFYRFLHTRKELPLLCNEICHTSSLYRSSSPICTSAQLCKDGIFQRAWKTVHYNIFMKSFLDSKACLIYTKLNEKLDTKSFFEVCHMPDTFFSWYLIMELHIWMICVRIMSSEIEYCSSVRDLLLKSFWIDIDQKSQQIGDLSSSKRKEQVQELYDHYATAFLSYDEALGGDDKVLASAVWRVLFNRECEDPQHLECCVHYIRSNLAHLNALPFGDFLHNGNFSFLPLVKSDELPV